MASQYSVLDVFAGAGGLTEGFDRQNFNFVSHIEMNPYAVKTLETRSIYHSLKNSRHFDLYPEYLKNRTEKNARVNFIESWKKLQLPEIGIISEEISVNSQKNIIKKIKAGLHENDQKKIDIIIGGPPCQAYSLIGRGRDPAGMANDPRNELYLHYLHFLKKFNPEIFIFENVPGILSAKKGKIYSHFQENVEKLGYYAEGHILNALNFGVLQNRKRVVLIGWKKSHNLEYPDFGSALPPFRIHDLLSDLPVPESGRGDDVPVDYRTGPTKYLKISGIRTKEKILLHHRVRRNNERDREIYRRAISIWNNERRRMRYDELPDNLKTHKNVTSFLDRFKVVDNNGYSHAMVAHLSKDGHYFIHPDINQTRSITVREAARIQSFPDNYIFEGPRTSQFVQIGNAVPPLMAEGIAKKIKEMLLKI
jgi:DNA (cytosine-5)-methyltransferase 1